MNNCSYTNILDIRPDNLLDFINCTYTYDNGVYTITKINDSSPAQLIFKLDFDFSSPTYLTIHTANRVCNTSITPYVRFYNGTLNWVTVDSSYVNGNNYNHAFTTYSDTYSNSKVQFAFAFSPHEFTVDLSKFMVEYGSSFTGYETYNCESLIPTVPEPTINGIHLYSMIEDNFITDNYYLNCGILIIFFTLVILLFNLPFLIIRKVRRY